MSGPGLELQGPNVVLRTFQPQDITDAYVGWLNDPLVVRFSNQRFRRHDAASCASYLAAFAGSPNTFLSIRARDTGEALGTATAYCNPHHGTADAGIMLGNRAAWGRGWGQEAWNLLTQWLLGRGDIRKLTAGTLACNRPMVRLMENAGMRLEAVRSRQEIVDGRAEDIVLYAKFRDA